MSRETFHMRYVCLITTFAVVILDLATKVRGFEREEPWIGLAPLLQTVQHRNYGLIFNIPAPAMLVVSISVVVLGAAFYFLRTRMGEMRVALGLGFLAGGALGNGYDRLVFGFVRDWILIGERSAINIADVAVILGLILILLSDRRARLDGAI